MSLSIRICTFLLFILSTPLNGQDFKSTFVQDDFLPIPLSAPLADSVVDGQVKQDPRCLEANDAGSGTRESWFYICTNKVIRFYFDANNSSCSAFLYSGEGGNQNNFLSEIDCLNNCYIDVNEGAPLKEEDVHMINQEADLGPGQGCLLKNAENGGKNCTQMERSVVEDQHFMA